MPRGESLWWPGSRCPGCDAAIAPWDNVPVLAWLWLRGRCRACKTPISVRYPLVEALTALLFGLAVWRFGPGTSAAVAALFAAALVAAAGIDFDHRIIPDSISLGGLGLGLSVVPWVRSGGGVPYGEAWLEAAAGALLGGGLLWGVGFVHARLCALQGRRFAHWPGDGEEFPGPRELDYWYWFPGMGFGDVKLLAMIGTVVGPLGVIQSILAASAFGLLLGLAWYLVRRDAAAPFGFGPALSAGALVALLAPPSLLPLG